MEIGKSIIAIGVFHVFAVCGYSWVAYSVFPADEPLGEIFS